MNGIKQIMVVSPDKYKFLARKLAHKISKGTGYKSAFWTIRQFEHNEFKYSGKDYVIFIGNSVENTLTKDFLTVIKNLVNQAGACYGYDGTKAVIFGEGKLDQKKDFDNVFKKSIAMITEPYALKTVGAGIALSFFTFNPISWISAVFPSLVEYLFRKEKEQKLRTKQTKIALARFLAEHFDNWIGIKK